MLNPLVNPSLAELELRYLREDEPCDVAAPNAAAEAVIMVSGPDNSSSCVRVANNEADLLALYRQVSDINPI